MTDAETTTRIDAAVASLCEHFDVVQILVSTNDEGETRQCFRGGGNWYARQGMAHAFINFDVAQDNARELAKQINPPDDGEAWKNS